MTIGAACRTLVAGLMTGLGDLVAAVRRDPSTSEYYIGGFDRLTPTIRQFCAVAAFAAYVSDGFLCEVLEDDRVARCMS